MIKQFLRSLGLGGIIGVSLLTAISLLAIFAPWIAPNDPFSIVGQPYIAPFTDPQFALGTDNLGRDILAGILHGAGSSLLVGLGAAIAAIFIGTIVGTIAGFTGGVIDETLMRITEAFQIIPSFLLALAFVSTIGNDIQTVILAIALGAWADPARLTRAQVLSIRERDYVASARAIGMHPFEIAVTQVLPNALPPVLSISATIVAGAILTEAALSFIGLGDPNIITWGAMIAEGQPILRSYPALSIIPGIALLITVLSIYLISESVNRQLILGGAPR